MTGAPATTNAVAIPGVSATSTASCGADVLLGGGYTLTASNANDLGKFTVTASRPVGNTWVATVTANALTSGTTATVTAYAMCAP